MSAHIVVSQLDAVNPATVSEPILKGLLRSALGFQGVVIADALGMEAIRGDLGAEHFPLLAHRAGLDLFLVAGDTVSLHDAVRLRDGLRRGVERGELSPDTMWAAQARIVSLMAAAKAYPVEELPVQLFERHARSAEALKTNAPWGEFHFEPYGFE
jgi:beta-N-acetylhexosaminidase